MRCTRTIMSNINITFLETCVGREITIYFVLIDRIPRQLEK